MPGLSRSERQGGRLGEKRPVVIVVGALAPYTHVLYELLAGRLDRPLHILACSGRETSRLWQIDKKRSYRFEVLPGLRWHRNSIVNHYVNASVVWRLARLRPAAVVVNDFAPTMVLAGAASRILGVPYGLRTDGAAEIDPGARSWLHRLVRRMLIPNAAFALGPSLSSKRLVETYGLKGKFALSPLFPAWQPQREALVEGRPFDVLFCGSLNEETKGARFFTDVMLGCVERGRPLKVRVVGAGPLREEMEARFASAGVAARFDGFLQQQELAEAYASARLFHFPTRGDVWGIVVQEALQSGTIVMASPLSGVARELLGPGRCGSIMPFDRPAWVTETLALLDDEPRQQQMREAGRTALSAYTPERAASAYMTMLTPILDEADSVRASHTSPDSVL